MYKKRIGALILAIVSLLLIFPGQGGIIFTIVFVSAMPSIFLWISKKRGYKEYSDIELKKMLSKKLPSYYKYVYYGLGPVFIILFLTIFLGILFSLDQIQRFLFFTPDLLYFQGVGEPFTVIMLVMSMLFVSILIAFFVCGPLLDLAFPNLEIFEKQKFYNKKEKARRPDFYALMKFDTKKIDSDMIKIASILTSVLIFAIFLTLGCYVKANQNEIVKSSFLFTEKYNWSDITSANISLSGNWDRDDKEWDANPELKFVATENRTIIMWTDYFIIRPKTGEILDLICKVKHEGIPINVTIDENALTGLYDQYTEDYQNRLHEVFKSAASQSTC